MHNLLIGQSLFQGVLETFLHTPSTVSPEGTQGKALSGRTVIESPYH